MEPPKHYEDIAKIINYATVTIDHFFPGNKGVIVSFYVIEPDNRIARKTNITQILKPNDVEEILGDFEDSLDNFKNILPDAGSVPPLPNGPNVPHNWHF